MDKLFKLLADVNRHIQVIAKMIVPVLAIVFTIDVLSGGKVGLLYNWTAMTGAGFSDTATFIVVLVLVYGLAVKNK